MTQTQSEKITQRLETQHDDVLRRLDELDRQILATLLEWSSVVEKDVAIVPRKK